MSDSQTSDRDTRHKALVHGFIAAIESYERGEINSRGLAQLAGRLSAPEEIDQVGDELLSHTFWVMRHLVHQPACWAPTPAELKYLLRCLHGETTFNPETARNHRQ
jgi:hypothetical protein